MEVRELRLRYSTDAMTDLIAVLDRMNLGDLRQEAAILLAQASNVANWHAVDDG